jgi:hypothetical protein
MDFVEINKFTQDKRVHESRDLMYKLVKIPKIDSLRLIVYACKKMYGVKNTAKILHGIGVDKIDLSL